MTTIQRGAFFKKRTTPKEDEEGLEAIGGQDELSIRKPDTQRDKHFTKQQLHQLATKTRLTTKKGYRPTDDVEGRIREIVEATCQVEQGWQQVALNDPKVKFKLLTKLIKEFDHDIPNSQLDKMDSVSNIVEYFTTPIAATTQLEDMSKLDLPKNLHIQWEYNRFNPETDTLYEGKTAYPGRDTHVTSIKYARKYKSIKTSKDKPGYVNHYFGY